MTIGGRVREDGDYNGYFSFGFDGFAVQGDWWYGALHHWFDEVQYAYIWVAGVCYYEYFEENGTTIGMHACDLEIPPSQYDRGCGAF